MTKKGVGKVTKIKAYKLPMHITCVSPSKSYYIMGIGRSQFLADLPRQGHKSKLIQLNYAIIGSGTKSFGKHVHEIIKKSSYLGVDTKS